MGNPFGMQEEMQSWKTDLWTHCSKGIGNIPSMQKITIAMECSGLLKSEAKLYLLITELFCWAADINTTLQRKKISPWLTCASDK